MVCRSFLDERPAPVVLDTSVVINLNATGCADAILRALPNRCVVVEHVSLELQVGRRTGRGDADALAMLIEQKLVEHAQVGDTGMRHFTTLVTGSAAETLDDGEAGTIACAVEQGAVALVDERKAIRGRMWIPDHHGQWILDLIGAARAVGCRSLPKRFTVSSRPTPKCLRLAHL